MSGFVAGRKAWNAIPRAVAESRFWSRVNKDGPVIRPELGPCWIWTGSKGPKGYGNARVPSLRTHIAHRVSWMLSVGPTGGLCVLHKCDNRPCVNPGHLFLGTKAVNNADMMAKGRQMRGVNHWDSRLTEAQVLEVRRSTLPGAQLARMLGVTPNAIYDIRGRITWRHLPVANSNANQDVPQEERR